MIKSFSRVCKNNLTQIQLRTISGTKFDPNLCHGYHHAKEDDADNRNIKDVMNRRRQNEQLMSDWKLLVGFEFHAQMKTKYKMFSSKVSV